MYNELLVLLGVISFKILLDTMNNKIDMNNDINDDINKYENSVNNDDKKQDNNIDKYKDKYIFLPTMNHCPGSYSSNFNRLFKNQHIQIPGYTNNKTFDITRYYNNRYKEPQPIFIE